MSRPTRTDRAWTDRVLDAIAAGRPVPACDALVAMLVAWRAEVLAEPLPHWPFLARFLPQPAADDLDHGVSALRTDTPPSRTHERPLP